MPRHRLQDRSPDVHPKRVDSPSDGRIAAKFRPALALLLEASEYADQTSGEPWEFAVEIQQLCELGLSHNDLRWLVRMQFVEHAQEVTVPGDDGREFRATGDLTFTERTCFVLTSNGVAAARQGCDVRSDHGTPCPFMLRVPDPPDVAAEPSLPKWDAEKRVLCFDGRIVKRFKWHAMNQETVLAAFEEDGWPVRIDDPLPPQPEQDSKRRLSDTIKCLNRKQQNPLIHFRGDGTGEGVIWELVEQDGSNGQGE
ncbi:MAG: hypothetical protein H8E44_26050 [Planctomycetes bacterium]|nr:hypothetical protein [Planctomycetota bacterium]